MKILIIGHQGYVGSGLFKYLSMNHEVMGWSRKDNILNITNQYLLKNNFDVVINCATVMDRTGTYFDTESLTYEVNIKGMESLVSNMKNTGIKLIFISTKDVYGNVFTKSDVVEKEFYYKLPYYVNDNHSFSPVSAYGKSKLIGEYITEGYSDYTIIRLSSCYTDFDHYRGHWVPNIIKLLISGSDVQLTNKGKQVRDLLHVDDLGLLINKVLKSNKKRMKVNAGGGKINIYSILQFIKLINSTSNITMSPGEDYGFVFSNESAKLEYEWEPLISFEDKLTCIKDNLIDGVFADSSIEH